MSGGVIVVAGVIGVFVFCETILPRAFAAWWKWRREQTRAKKEGEVGTQLPSANAILAKADVATTARNTASAPQSAFAKVDASRGTDETTLAVPGCGAARAEQNDDSKARVSLATPENTESAHRAGDLRSDDAEARRLWEEAQGIPHQETPDFASDWRYMSLLHKAAKLGHLEATATIGEYAYQRGAIVEAFYWTKLAEARGARGLGRVLLRLRTEWRRAGCPDESENTYGAFSEEQREIAHAALRLQCGVDPQYARTRLKELAERGVEEARLFLGRGNALKSSPRPIS